MFFFPPIHGAVDAIGHRRLCLAEGQHLIWNSKSNATTFLSFSCWHVSLESNQRLHPTQPPFYPFGAARGQAPV
jgi:hypothetical protein